MLAVCALEDSPQIEKRLEQIGHVNVTRMKGENYTYKMIKATSDMLGNGFPIFISAIPKQWSKGYSWVIDGAKYSPENKYLIHCNFGWEVFCNGYFSTSCLNPSRADSYRLIGLCIAAAVGIVACGRIPNLKILDTPTEYDYHSHDFEFATNIDFDWVVVNATGNDLTREFRNDTGKKRNFCVDIYTGTCPQAYATILINQHPKLANAEE